MKSRSIVLFLAFVFYAPSLFAAAPDADLMPLNYGNSKKNVPDQQPPVLSAADWLPLRSPEVKKDLHDHQAKIFEVQGTARVLKHGTDAWVPLQKEMTIEAGDQIITEENSKVRVAYDGQFLNIAVIQEKTKAEFRSIEPTDVYLEDGNIFSAVDELDGGVYQISTPTAVAAARGTHFSTAYSMETGLLSVALFPDGGEASHVEIMDLNQGEAGDIVNLDEGEKLVSENDNTLLTQEAVEEMAPEEIQEYKEELGEVLEGVDTEARQEVLEQFEPETVAEEALETLDEELSSEPVVDSEVDQALKADQPESEADSSLGETEAVQEYGESAEDSGESFEDSVSPELEFTAEEGAPEFTEFVTETDASISLHDETTSAEAEKIEESLDTSGTDEEKTGSDGSA